MRAAVGFAALRAKGAGDVSWLRVTCATLAAVAVCFPLGMAAEFVWANCFVSLSAFLLLTLVSLRLHPRRARVAGVPVAAGLAGAS